MCREYVQVGLFFEVSNHLRMSCMSGTYCNAYSREKILEVLTWSFTCLSISSAFDWTVKF